MKILLLILSICFFIALFNSLFHQDMSNAIFQLTASVVLFSLYLYLLRDERKQNEFTLWLQANRDSLLASEENIYDGIRMDAESELVQYEICFSFGIVSFRNRTRYFVKDYHATPLLNLLFTLYSLVWGWWSIPFGPIYTLRAIGYNLFSKPKKLRTILEESAAEQAISTPPLEGKAHDIG